MRRVRLRQQSIGEKSRVSELLVAEVFGWLFVEAARLQDGEDIQREKHGEVDAVPFPLKIPSDHFKGSDHIERYPPRDRCHTQPHARDHRKESEEMISPHHGHRRHGKPAIRDIEGSPSHAKGEI